MPNNKPTKYIFVLGSVLSGLGKGILTSAIGKILQVHDRTITVVKIDPYLNIDAGTMSPFEHGETYVTDDGGELDPDFGHYERFLGLSLNRDHNITTGQVYFQVITKERKGEYLGKTVQVVPHVIEEIILRLKGIEEKVQPDVMLVEVGGTIGDIESQPFLEAIRQLKRDKPKNELLILLLTYVPYPAHIAEHKTKPTQHSVSQLRASGLVPNAIVCRSDYPVDEKTREKIAFFCDVDERDVFDLPDLENVFEAPLKLAEQQFSRLLNNQLSLDLYDPIWDPVHHLIGKINGIRGEVVIGIPGKYTDLADSYISVNEALKHAGIELGRDVRLQHIATEDLEEDPNRLKILDKVDGVLVPGGFGDRGTEGKIMAIQYARENNIPFLGICLGFQLAIVEFSRNVLGLKQANSTEMNPDTPHPVVTLQEEQKDIVDMGGTMRLGSYPIELVSNTRIQQLYDEDAIQERHRHRYEVNAGYFEQLEQAGLQITGFYNKLAESFELKEHRYFMGTQFHPEFKSRPDKPAPPYLGLVRAAVERAEQRK